MAGLGRAATAAPSQMPPHSGRLESERAGWTVRAACPGLDISPAGSEVRMQAVGAVLPPLGRAPCHSSTFSLRPKPPTMGTGEGGSSGLHPSWRPQPPRGSLRDGFAFCTRGLHAGPTLSAEQMTHVVFNGSQWEP